MKVIKQLIDLEEHKSNDEVIKAVQEALAELDKQGTLKMDVSSGDIKQVSSGNGNKG